MATVLTSLANGPDTVTLRFPVRKKKGEAG